MNLAGGDFVGVNTSKPPELRWCRMPIELTVHANDDDVLIAWRPNPWPDAWVGFAIEKRNVQSGQIAVLNNRIPPTRHAGAVPEEGLPSTVSPIRRCIWTDHSVDDTDQIAYRVAAMAQNADGSFVRVAGSESDWTPPLTVTAEAGEGAIAVFNRGTLMSQIVSRFVGSGINVASLKRFKARLSEPGFPARRYLAGQARHRILSFLADADRRGNQIFAALYELNDQELIDALKAFGQRGNVLVGNGSSTKPGVVDELGGTHLAVHERDLSGTGASSPSVHNKFVVEFDPRSNKALRVLTGSTNWTTTGLCTQLNNVLIIENTDIAARFHAQWNALILAGDAMPNSLKVRNAEPTTSGSISVMFAATPHKEEFGVIEHLISNAQDGLFFLMFTPGQSPLLDLLLARSQGDVGPYVRGVVSEVRESNNGSIIAHGARVIRRGEEKLFRDSTLLPDGLPSDNLPAWAREEFNRRMFFPAGLNAIVHSKVIVVDPFSDNCAVVTGSHNFSDSASQKNDENVVIVKGNKAVAAAYAVHIQGVYDHYSWRAFLSEGGNPDVLFQSLDEWKPDGARARDLAFWLR
jgi:phosphatidylserine/phosphatidylglycerophosphate/cardiolipin synthase-like enzyme